MEVPCDGEEDFYARFRDRVAARGLRVPTEVQRPVGTRVKLALVLRDGRTLDLEGVVDAHVRVDERPGVNVRILHFPRDASGGAAPPPGAPAARRGSAALPAADEPLGDVLFADLPELAHDEPPAVFGAGTVSREIVEVVNRRAARVQRVAIALAVAALVVGVASLGVVRWLRPMGPEAHVAASDRLLAEGRLTGRDGALEHLLEARRLRPDDAATNGRLSRVADLLEGLAARALERGDVAVAEIHLASAELAAPGRASIRAKREAIARRTSAGGAAAPQRTGGDGKRRSGSR